MNKRVKDLGSETNSFDGLIADVQTVAEGFTTGKSMMRQLEISFDSLKVKGSYYNTTSLKGKELVKEKENASDQEERIMQIFSVKRIATPSEIMRRYELLYPAIPITSIRRAMTNLTKDGRLIKMEEKRTGMYGKPEHCWMLK